MRFLIILILVLLNGFTLSAQSEIGFKVGTNYSNLGFSSFTDLTNTYSYKLDIHSGLTFNRQLNEKLQANVELLYSRKGYNNEFQDGSESRVSLTYFTLPVLLGLEAIDNVTLLIGPEIGYLIGAQSKTNGVKTDIRNLWPEKLDIGLSAGVRVDLSSIVYLEGRYTQGLTGIQDITFVDDNGFDLGTAQARNRNWQISLGFRYPFEW